MSPTIALVVLVGVAVAVLLAISGVGRNTTPDPPGLVTVTATEFAYSPTRIGTTTNTTLRLRNEGAVYHDLRIEGIDDFSLEALPDEQARCPACARPQWKGLVVCPACSSMWLYSLKDLSGASNEEKVSWETP